MRILGINHDMYITSAALIEDGRIIAASPEERLTRQKRTRGFPIEAIQFCLGIAGYRLEDIDYIANSYNPGVHLEKFHPLLSRHRRFRGEYLYSVPDYLFTLLDKKEKRTDFIRQTIQLDSGSLDIYFLTHHLCHAANGYFLSPFEEAAILTADGRGETDTVCFGVGRENHIEIIKRMSIPQSVGSFYSTFTSFLGFKPDSDEWKVMALSAYAEAQNVYYDKIRNLVNLREDGEFEIDLAYFKEHIHETPGCYSEKMIELLGPPREPDDDFQPRHYQIAGAMQQVTEEIMANMLGWLYQQTKMKNIAVSGGSFMNSVLNGKISSLSPFNRVFVSSCPDDSGLSIGAALYLYNHILGKTERYEQHHNFYGPGFTNGEVEEVLKKYGLSYIYENDVEEVISRELSQGKLIGWFQGKMEFGQRALGNRSILADPRDSKMKDKVNSAVKYRESFRPFAPAVLEERAAEYFDINGDEKVPFMEKVYLIRKEKRELIPAVVHEDGSGRLQTVSRKTNPRFYKLIENFCHITGIPILLNTSFNLNGEPIVCDPTDAIRTFHSCGLDTLVLNDFVIRK